MEARHHWQLDAVAVRLDLTEALSYVTYLDGRVRYSSRITAMAPNVSLDHSTGNHAGTTSA